MNLYHYTDQAGFLGILDSKEIWATNVQCLNDSTEFKIAFEYVPRVLEIFEHGYYVSSEAVNLIERISIDSGISSGLNCCVFSLSKQGDLLSQWRGYSKGQAGVSIGFGSIEIIKYLKELSNNSVFYYLEECIYDKYRQRRMVQEEILSYFDVNSSTYEIKVSSKKYETSNYVRQLMLLAASFKDNSFSEEKEYRIIVFCDNNKLSHRPGKSYILPYFKIPLNDLSVVTRVIVGHTPDPKVAVKSVQSFLAKKGACMDDSLLNVEVKESRIPFRNW